MSVWTRLHHDAFLLLRGGVSICFLHLQDNSLENLHSRLCKRDKPDISIAFLRDTKFTLPIQQNMQVLCSILSADCLVLWSANYYRNGYFTQTKNETCLNSVISKWNFKIVQMCWPIKKLPQRQAIILQVGEDGLTVKGCITWLNKPEVHFLHILMKWHHAVNSLTSKNHKSAT